MPQLPKKNNNNNNKWNTKVLIRNNVLQQEKQSRLDAIKLFGIWHTAAFVVAVAVVGAASVAAHTSALAYMRTCIYVYSTVQYGIYVCIDAYAIWAN